MISGNNILLINAKSGDYGGMEIHVLELIKAFSGANNVYVFCPQGPIVSAYKKAGAVVYNEVPKTPYDFSYATKVKEFCKEKRIHVVHAHELISAQGMLGAFLAKTPKRVWHVHTPFLLWKHKDLKTKLFKGFLNWVTNFFTANIFATDVIALTEEIKRHRIRLEMVLPFKVRVVPNAIDTNRFSKNPGKERLAKLRQKYNIPQNKIIIGNLSRTSAEKGQMVLFKAFKELYKETPGRYFLLVAGGGELEDSLNQSGSKNFKGSYKVTGKFDEKDKATFYHLFDYFVFPSLAEGFGYVLVEAMSSKIPVLASNIPVLQKVGGSGVKYFKVGDSADLYNQLKELVSLPKKEVDKLISLNSKKVEEYSFEAFAQNYSTIYGS